VLSPALQAVGIASANTIAYTLQAILLMLLLSKIMPSPFKLGGSLLKSLLAAAIGGGAAYAVINWVPGLASTLIGSFVAFGSGGGSGSPGTAKNLHEIAEL